MTVVSIYVHDIGSREIRVKFSAPVEAADDASAYVIRAVGGAHVPGILSARYYDADKMSVVLALDSALTRFEQYICAAMHLWSTNGHPVTENPFGFVATDLDAPIALGAFLSTRGCVDVVFDRPVAATSVAASADLMSSGIVSMDLVPWSAGQSENNVRFRFDSAAAGSEFVVRYSGVFDESGNSSSGYIPLTLAHAVTGYADLVQAKITAANFVDVSNAKQFATSVVRVHFSCPMSHADITNKLKWLVVQHGAHAAPDISNQVTAAAAVGEASLIALVNQAKVKLNAHFGSSAHTMPDQSNLVELPPATDFESARCLLQAEQTAYLLHLKNEESHLYADEMNMCSGLAPVDLADALSKANDFKSKYNGHTAAIYQVPFSSAYLPVGPIANFSSVAIAPPVVDQFTWYADLHLATSATRAVISVYSVGIRSEDMASSSSQAIEASPYSSSLQIMCATPIVRGVRLRAASGVAMRDADSVSVKQGARSVAAKAHAAGSLSTLLWAYNNTLHAYRMHISDPASAPFVGAQHKELDTVNTVSSSEYATQISLSSLIFRTNALKMKLSSHFSSDVFHYGRDAEVEFDDAADQDALADLIDHLQMRLQQHNSAGFAANGDAAQSVPLYHEFPGISVSSAPVRDLLVVQTEGLVHGALADVEMRAVKTWHDNRPNHASRTSSGHVSERFVGIDSVPVLTSAVARSGLDGPSPSHLLPDSVELYMSKPMRQTSVVPGANVLIDGMTLLDASWLSDRVASVRVAGMSNVAYTVQVTGVHDRAGNPLHEDVGPL